MYVRPPETRLPTHEYPSIWYGRLLRKPVQELQIWLKSDKNIGLCTWSNFIWLTATPNILQLDNSTKGNHSCFHGSTEHFSIVDSYTQVNNTKGTYCCVSMSAMLTRKRHSVTCVHLFTRVYLSDWSRHGAAFQYEYYCTYCRQHNTLLHLSIMLHVSAPIMDHHQGTYTVQDTSMNGSEYLAFEGSQIPNIHCQSYLCFKKCIPCLTVHKKYRNM
jgi:hypothetical protein